MDTTAYTIKRWEETIATMSGVDRQLAYDMAAISVALSLRYMLMMKAYYSQLSARRRHLG